MSKTYQIIVTTEGGGNFTYSPSTLQAKTGDLVGWSSDTGPFAVSFMDQTPFNAVSFSSHGNGKQHLIDAIRIRNNAIGHHHYAVAVASVKMPDQAGGTPTVSVMLDSGCPDIIVSNDGP